MGRLPLPPPRRRLHPLRDLSSAVTAVHELPGYRRRLTIDHAPLRAVTPAMVSWWFHHIGGTTAYDGEEVPRYLALHPEDHIAWELARPAPDGGTGEGARFRIVEAFQRRPEFYVDTTENVEKLDETGIRLVRRIAGVPVLQLEHTWSRAADGTHYVSVMDIGARSRLLTPLNRHLNERRFPPAMARAWLRHNVEEVGLLEHLLPQLYAEHHAPAPGTTVRGSEAAAAT